jgi:transposase-like protein
LKGLPDAIAATWPLATIQTCVVHLVRSSLRYASKADWSKITAEPKGVYTAPTVAAAEQRFAEFAERWRDKYPAMVAMWERSWPEFVPFLDFRACCTKPSEIVSTTTFASGSAPSSHIWCRDRA